MIKDGKLLMKGTHKDILSHMENKVYNVQVKNECEVDDIQSKGCKKIWSLSQDCGIRLLRWFTPLSTGLFFALFFALRQAVVQLLSCCEHALLGLVAEGDLIAVV